MSKTLCLTIGDPTGIGPEITAKFLQHFALQHTGHQLVVYGDIYQLERTAELLHIGLPTAPQIIYRNVQDVSGQDGHAKSPGRVAYDALEAAVSDIHRGHGDILVTGPISKENLQAADIGFSGHTEILQHLARKLYGRPYQSDMLFLFRQFRMLLLTRHVALRKVHEELSIRGVQHSLDSLIVFLKEQAGIANPRLCLLGVNPHAGELDGEEEERVLMPAIRFTNEKHQVHIPPPVPADAAFRNFNLNDLAYDAYVAAYHDQGLIPFKMVAGYEAVNVTIGLPFLRTSVSHGTAPDIVGQGIADPSSLIEAYNTAVQLISQHQPHPESELVAH